MFNLQKDEHVDEKILKDNLETHKKISKKVKKLLIFFVIVSILYLVILFIFPFKKIYIYYAIFGFIFIIYLIKNISVKEQIKELIERKQELLDLINPLNNTKELHSERIEVIIAENLVPLAELNEERGLLLTLLPAKRKKVAIERGYIIPNIKIKDDETFENNLCKIFIKGNLKQKFKVYPDLLCVKCIPDDYIGEFIKENYICYDSPLFWIKKENFEGEQISPVEIIHNIIEFICIKHVDEIIVNSDVKEIITNVWNIDKAEYVRKSIENGKLKEIFSNLIKENISIKDLQSVMELSLCIGLDENKSDYISEKIRENNIFKSQITNKYSKEGIIEAYELSEELTVLIESAETYKQEKYIINILKSTLSPNKTNLIICNKKIRLKLYRIINEVFIKTDVIAYEEIIKNTEIKQLGLIDIDKENIF